LQQKVNCAAVLCIWLSIAAAAAADVSEALLSQLQVAAAAY
jgi:hypothetical protein